MQGVFKRVCQFQPSPASSWGRFTSPYPSAGPRTGRRPKKNCRITGIMSALISAPFSGQFLDAPQSAPWTPSARNAIKTNVILTILKTALGGSGLNLGSQRAPKRHQKTAHFHILGPLVVPRALPGDFLGAPCPSSHLFRAKSTKIDEKTPQIH